MRQWLLEPSQWAEETWCCSWRYATTPVGGEWFAISRAPYVPMDGRWERAVADDLPSDTAHAFGFFTKTLCGIESAGMSPSDYLWMPKRSNACGACREAAAAIDERWPHEMRGSDARISAVKQPVE